MTATRRPRGPADRALRELELIPIRRLVIDEPQLWFGLAPGDRAFVATGDMVSPGDVLAERSRTGETITVHPPAREAASLTPGDRWPPGTHDGHGRRRAADRPGEALFAYDGGWRIAVPDRLEPIASPVAGTVTAAQPGRGIVVRATGRAIRGTSFVGGATRGVLEMAARPAAELRATAIDVGSAGAVLIGGASTDAEALTRARATGVAGVVVATLATSVRRELAASDARRRAALHPGRPFGVLVLDGAARRPIAGPIAAMLATLSDHDVALAPDPPTLLWDDPGVALPMPPPDLVRILAGQWIGRDGRWLGLLERRRTSGGPDALVGSVDVPGLGTVAVPVGDLERFG